MGPFPIGLTPPTRGIGTESLPAHSPPAAIPRTRPDLLGERLVHSSRPPHQKNTAPSFRATFRNSESQRIAAPRLCTFQTLVGSDVTPREDKNAGKVAGVLRVRRRRAQQTQCRSPRLRTIDTSPALNSSNRPAVYVGRKSPLGRLGFIFARDTDACYRRPAKDPRAANGGTAHAGPMWAGGGVARLSCRAWSP